MENFNTEQKIQQFEKAKEEKKVNSFLSAKEIKRLFFFSDFISKTAIKNPAVLKNIEQKQTKEDFAKRISEEVLEVSTKLELTVLLKKIREKEMVRIAVRDILYKADLFETMEDLTFLAERLIDETLNFLYKEQAKKFGFPEASEDGEKQNIVVFGVGKIGAFELNFSSDVDLIFAYPKSGYTNKRTNSISNERFFLNIARDFLQIFEDKKQGGIIFRIDLRLRPYGENGALIMNFNAMEDYYQYQGREWERYALIKTRVIAGDKKKGDEFLKSIRPFIYRKYLDYGVFASLRQMKKGIENSLKQDALKDNIKLGRGGIREIEFFVQIFQLLRGGLILSLQERGVLKALKNLKKERIIQDREEKDLREAYIFLRYVENRLQQFEDKQTHSLPKSKERLLKLAESLKFKTIDAFFKELLKHTENVHKKFSSLLEIEDEKQNIKETEFWETINEKEISYDFFKNSNFKDFEKIFNALISLKKSFKTLPLTSQKLLDSLIPILIKKTQKSKNPDTTFFRIIEFVKTIDRRTAYVSLLIENPRAIDSLISLSSESSWITNFLCKNPLLLDELLDERNALPELIDLEGELNRRINNIPEDDIEKLIDTLRIFKKTNVFRVASSDITKKYPLMRVSDHLSLIAEVLVRKVLDIAFVDIVKKYGKPNKYYEKGFIVVAYGKLGGIELGYNSDLDIVFLYDAKDGLTSGKKPIETSLFFARLGQKIINFLSVRTSAGVLYEIDLRLRPSGIKGTVVSKISTFYEYQKNSAWTFEHQALIRARVIAGDIRLKEKFKKIRKEILLKVDKIDLKENILKMAASIKKEHLKKEEGLFDLKYDNGGIVDIEFLVQYIVLRNAEKYEDLTIWTDNVRLLETIAKYNLLSKDDTEFLKIAYLTYRSEVHSLSLKEEFSKVSLEKAGDLHQKVISIWNTIFNLE